MPFRDTVRVMMWLLPPTRDELLPLHRPVRPRGRVPPRPGLRGPEGDGRRAGARQFP